MLRASGVVFFAYIGFDAVSVAAQEAKNPQRNMPIGILGSLVICTVLYMLMSLVITGLAPYSILNVPQPVAVSIQNGNSSLAWLIPLVNFGATAGLGTVVLVLLLGQSVDLRQFRLALRVGFLHRRQFLAQAENVLPSFAVLRGRGLRRRHSLR